MTIGSAVQLLMVRPDHFEVIYTINPWMDPEQWAANSHNLLSRAKRQWRHLAGVLRRSGAVVERAPSAPGLPDLVFPANAAVVLDGRALMARFLHPERQREEPCNLAYFEHLQRIGLLSEVEMLPPGLIQEGAGDCLWDATRGQFWAGWGQRSSRESVDAVRGFFNVPVVPLELGDPRFYHLDIALAPLAGGEVIIYPPAFTPAALRTLTEFVDKDRLIAVAPEEAEILAANVIALGRTIIVPGPAPRLCLSLQDRGYRAVEVDLSAFLHAGGGAFCLTLRLDHRFQPPVMAESRPTPATLSRFNGVPTVPQSPYRTGARTH